MWPAIIGLVGVVIGGVLSSTLSAHWEHRRERLKSRTAARLLLERFEAALGALKTARSIASDPTDQGESAAVFKSDFQTPEWGEARVLLADQLDSEAFAALSRGVKKIHALHDYASRFENRADPSLLLSVTDLDIYWDQLKRPSALLALLAEADLRSPPIRLWQKWRRPPKITALAFERYFREEIERIREKRAAESADAPEASV